MNIAKAKMLVMRRHWYQQGQMAEYERIIELLSNIAWTSIAKTDDDSRMVSTKDIIKLIQGETNGNI
jgi:hypothetical protein